MMSRHISLLLHECWALNVMLVEWKGDQRTWAVGQVHAEAWIGTLEKKFMSLLDVLCQRGKTQSSEFGILPCHP